MKLSLRDQAGISALWGTIFLFLLPITAGVVYAQSDWQGTAALLLVVAACVISAAVGAVFFVQAASQLTSYSQDKIRKSRP